MIDPGQSHLIAPYVKETYNFKDKIYFCPPKNWFNLNRFLKIYLF